MKRLLSVCVRIFTILLFSALCAVPAGCNIIAPAYAVIAPEPTAPAQYVLPDVPTVVYVDDRANVIPSNTRAVRVAIADACSRVLMQEGALTTAISPGDAMAFVRANDSHSELLSIADIANAVGADQIIYVEMLALRTQMAGVPKPNATCQVRVLDVAHRQRTFPAGETGEPAVIVNASMREVDPQVYRSMSSRLKIFDALAETMGEEIAKLFYEHEIRDLGGNLNTR
jgi:hypothetical protein